jgi:two-component sensor histidine kinase
VSFVLDEQGIFLLSEGQGLARLGLQPGQVVGLSALEVYQDYPPIAAAVEAALAGHPLRSEAAVQEVVFDVTYTPILDDQGRVRRVIGVGYDITGRKLAEDAIRSLLREKETLLRELQHRAKNSFASMAGLIALRKDASPSSQAREALAELEPRVKALADLYDLLYQVEAVSQAPLETYCARVAAALPFPPNVRVVETYDALSVPVKTASAVGLILTELLTNAIKYAFPGERSGTVRVSLRREGPWAFLEVADDGVGLPQGFDPAMDGALGLSLVQALAAEIRGQATLLPGEGTHWQVRFEG